MKLLLFLFFLSLSIYANVPTVTEQDALIESSIKKTIEKSKTTGYKKQSSKIRGKK